MTPAPKKENRGSKPGERRGGRQRGSKNKATIEREAKALAIQTTLAGGSMAERELAKDALMRLAIYAEGAAAACRPTTEADIKAGTAINPDGDWDRHRGWIDLSARIYKWGADFQSPKMLAVAVAAPPPSSDGEQKAHRMTLTVFEDGRAVKRVQAGQRWKHDE